MCIVAETTMSCGHRLASVQRCKRPSPCRAPSTKNSRINDTCARCDREVHFHVIRAAYEEDHARLVRRYIRARADHRPEEVERVRREIAALHRATRQKNATVNTLRGDPDVLWS